MKTVTRKCLARVAANALESTQAEGMAAVNDILTTIQDKILTRDEVKIPRFGKFNRRLKSSRPSRDPQTGEATVISERTVVTFKPSQLFRDAVNTGTVLDKMPSVQSLYLDDEFRDEDIERAARAILAEIVRALTNGDRVGIRGFGVFSARGALR